MAGRSAAFSRVVEGLAGPVLLAIAWGELASSLP
jgi:hypothetical protein